MRVILYGHEIYTMQQGCHHATWIRAIASYLNHLFWINLISYHIQYMLSYIAWFRAVFVSILLAANMTNSTNYSDSKYCLLCFQTQMSCPNHFAAQMSSGAVCLRMLVNQGLPQFIFHGYFSHVLDNRIIPDQATDCIWCFPPTVSLGVFNCHIYLWDNIGDILLSA